MENEGGKRRADYSCGILLPSYTMRWEGGQNEIFCSIVCECVEWNVYMLYTIWYDIWFSYPSYTILYSNVLCCTILYTPLWYFLVILMLQHQIYIITIDCHLDGIDSMIIHLSISHQECRIIGWTAQRRGNDQIFRKCHDCSSDCSSSHSSVMSWL